jgi:hypothetical protein
MASKTCPRLELGYLKGLQMQKLTHFLPAALLIVTSTFSCSNPAAGDGSEDLTRVGTFVSPLAIPPIMDPTGRSGGVTRYTVEPVDVPVHYFDRRNDGLPRRRAFGNQRQ